MPPASTPHATQAYAYAATVIGSIYNRLCGRSGEAPAVTAACHAGLAEVKRLRAASPLARWDDPKHGRVAEPPQGWPGSS